MSKPASSAEPADYRRRLFETYHDSHLAHIGAQETSKQEWTLRYFRAYHLPHLEDLREGDARILEIGCSTGHLLAALCSCGFRDLHGIDLSTKDVELARRLAPQATVACTDALTYLRESPKQYDAIILKAVLEHVPKSGALPLLAAIGARLTARGRVVVDVPNMDWLFASHERYFDFTHETGFTPQSLRQLLGNAFGTVEVATVDNIFPQGGLDRFRVRVGRAVLGTLLAWADGQGGGNSIWHRSIVAIAKNPLNS